MLVIRDALMFIWRRCNECCPILVAIFGLLGYTSPMFVKPMAAWIALVLTHWGRVTHICVGKLTSIGSDNGLSPDRRQAIIWNNAGILLIRPLGTNFSEILIGIQTFSFKTMHLKMSSAKWHPFVSASMYQMTLRCLIYWSQAASWCQN